MINFFHSLEDSLMENNLLNFRVEIPFGLAMVATFVGSGYFSPLEINANSKNVTLLINSYINDL